MGKSKGAPKRARSTSRKLYSLPPEAELGAGNVVEDVLGGVLRTFGPRIADAIVAKLSAAPGPTPPSDVNGRLIRMETQVGYLSNNLHGLDNRTKALAAEVEELRQRLAAVERH